MEKLTFMLNLQQTLVRQNIMTTFRLLCWFQLCSPKLNNLFWSVYSDVFLSELVFISSAVACWIRLHQPAFALQWAMATHDPLMIYHCSFLWPLLVYTDRFRPETPHKSCSTLSICSLSTCSNPCAWQILLHWV